jgi:hypothetical protein
VYDPVREPPREYICAGDVGGPLDMVGMRGASGRVKYVANLTLLLQIRVHLKGQKDTEQSDARAEAITDLVVNYIAANPTLGGMTGLKKASVNNAELSGFQDDDGATSIYTLQIGLMPLLS